MRRNSRGLGPVLGGTFTLFLAPAITQAAGAPDRLPAHRWEDTSRLERRFNNEANDSRIATARAAGRLSSELPAGAVFIAGRSNPELFLRWELFQQLVRNALLAPEPTRTVFRAQYDVVREKLRLPPSLWEDLERICHRWLLSLRAQDDAVHRAKANGTELHPEDLAGLRRDDCALRAAALRMAIQHFGHEIFDLFLYDAVAPGMVLVAEPEDPIAAAARLRWVQEGCR